jgi:hypothetical protein
MFEELAGFAQLRLQVVLVDLRTNAHFLDDDRVLLLSGVVLLLLGQVLVLAIVQDLADGRARFGGDFDQVELLFLGDRQSVVGVNDSELVSVLVDQADLPDANVVVDSSFRLCRCSSS